jgi:4-amino-4-deoxy-L-arabinose transferase-like glycosyltransferase
MALCLYAGAVEGRRRWWGALGSGVCLGIGALIRPTFVLLPIPLGLHMLLSWPRKLAALRLAALMAAGVALAVLPWTARNYHVTGGFILISSNGGGNLYSANNDEAQGAYTESAWQYLYDNARDDLELQRMGFQRAVQWITTHPRRFGELAVIKFCNFWQTDKDMAWWALQQVSIDHPELGTPREAMMLAEGGSVGFYLVCLLAGAVGLWRHRRRLRKRRGWMFLTPVLLYFTLVHMVFEAQAKYHYMLTPLLGLYAALVVVPAREPPAAERAAGAQRGHGPRPGQDSTNCTNSANYTNHCLARPRAAGKQC